MSLPAADIIPAAQYFGCIRKIPYRSRKQIRDAIARLLRNPKSPKLTYYRCEHCGLYHLTRKGAK